MAHSGVSVRYRLMILSSRMCRAVFHHFCFSLIRSFALLFR